MHVSRVWGRVVTKRAEELQPGDRIAAMGPRGPVAWARVLDVAVRPRTVLVTVAVETYNGQPTPVQRHRTHHGERYRVED